MDHSARHTVRCRDRCSNDCGRARTCVLDGDSSMQPLRSVVDVDYDQGGRRWRDGRRASSRIFLRAIRVPVATGAMWSDRCPSVGSGSPLTWEDGCRPRSAASSAQVSQACNAGSIPVARSTLGQVCQGNPDQVVSQYLPGDRIPRTPYDFRWLGGSCPLRARWGWRAPGGVWGCPDRGDQGSRCGAGQAGGHGACDLCGAVPGGLLVDQGRAGG